VSALTPAYASTPSPLGRPGGPGLWNSKTRKLPDYIENIARGIMQGGEPDKSRAIALAIGAVKRWASGGGKVSPEVRAAAAAALAEWEALKASAHAHANGGGMTIGLSVYQPPHVPAGSPDGGQFGTTSAAGTNSGGTAGKTPAQQHALHMAHVAHLQHLVATGKASPAQQAELAGLLKALNAPKGKAASLPSTPPAAVKPKAAATPKAKAAPKAVKAVPAKPVVNRKKGTVTAVIGGKKVTMTLHQWHALHVAHVAHVNAVAAQAKTAKLASDGGRFLDLAVAAAIAVDPAARRQVMPPAERVAPGVPEGGQYASRPAQFGRHDTPERTAAVINGMGPQQRAAVRASTLPPPGFEWRPGDRLAAA
jgi:hypothetical protein